MLFNIAIAIIKPDENKTKNLLQKNIYLSQNFYSDRILKKICNKKELGLMLIFGSVILLAIIPSSVVGIVWGQITTTPLVSTRDHFNLTTGNLLPEHNSTNYDPSDNIPGLDRQCEGEVAIYVHGVWTTADFPSFPHFEDAIEIFDRARMSLADLNYEIPLIGFSWDSDTPISPAGWETAKIIAKKNGPKLAEFIYDLKEKCPNTAIQLIAHSMGARVVLSSLDSLTNNLNWNNNNYTISSVHLMGAAVDDEEVSKNSNDIVNDPTNDIRIKAAYGNGIEKEVVRFYNLYNPEDDVLEGDAFECAFFVCQPIYYPQYEHDLALGQSGAQLGINIPENYGQINAISQIDFIIDADGDGFCDLFIPFTAICTIYGAGDNHFGYVGFRYPFSGPFVGTLRDNGAMNIVVDNWNNPL
jgi:hypothetical protein